MEPAQTVDVYPTVVRPDTLNQVGDTGCPLDAKDGLVNQIECVAHFPGFFSCQLLPAHTAHNSLELAKWASSSIQSVVVRVTFANA
jgi:hypothetical protein